MKTFKTLLLSLSLIGLALPVYAEELQQVTRSAGKFKLDDSIDLSQALRQREPVSKAIPTLPENYANSGTVDKLAGIANRHDQLFEIYEADVILLSDFDGDGFHHEIGVYFDVDVSEDSANVYAKLYLSREGGPWSQYFTTDLFHIDGDLASDAYEVATELIDGYDPGYYEVLIEIYSLDHAFMVASKVLDSHYLGKDVPLEDLRWDEPHDEFFGEVHVSAGANSLSLLIFLLIVQVAIAARGILTLTPCKNNDKIGTPELRSFY